ncbi:MAG: 4-hydroxy-tetrahydrodipicolinate synthase [Candidatus Auribacter fodinae]|jgi:4-hydroxy-tetrahydrodipicolinate synthase|uniref:4-hydroxy-tetrahydrodipicolinate synthase n=1 Tax=Candidatus Auribacter fodinae TaxID=2093366 RepID=A0A3A4R7D2_9BACT|nr:MAG: 4-hydroxy-tetrahydrodipicolinate synthase [Candidatus Auribacter fodinae]
MFQGSFVAIVTPFSDNKLDEQALRELIREQIKNGTHGIVPCGTTGESPTLSYEEHNRVVDIAIEECKGRVPVIAGAGSNSTSETLMLTRHAKEAGADAVLLITPYYNKPTQDGLYSHFKTVAEEVDIPIVLYNVPGRTGVNIAPETVERLAQIPNIVAIKEASGSLDQVSQILSRCGITVLSGDDSLVLPMMSVGGKGVISVAANVLPGRMSALVNAGLKGDWKTAKKIHYELYPIFKNMFIETNPIPVKSSLAMMGMIKPEIRLPLTFISDANKKKLLQVLSDYPELAEKLNCTA